MSEMLGSLADIHYGKSPSEVLDNDGQYPVVGTGGPYARARSSLFSSAIVVPRKGSLGKPWLVRGPSWPADTTYAVVPNAGVNIDWLFYNLLNFDLTKLNEATGVPSISRDWLKKIRFTKQDGPLQNKIAKILQIIDDAIEKTEALIEKYGMIKAGIMHDLFSRGLAPDGKLRPPRDQAPELYKETPSGWIPMEWNATELKDCVRSAQYGISTALSDVQSGIPVLRMNNIQENEFDVTDLKYSESAEANFLRLNVGDVLYNRTNSMQHVGKTAIWREELPACSFASYLVRINLHDMILNADFFAHWMNQESSRNALRKYATPAVQQVNINPTNLQKIWIAYPNDMVEQKEIANRLDLLSDKLKADKNLVAKLEAEKRGLMHDLLTGKVFEEDEPEEAANV